jgi:tetratricopeptide (TPR) repeat protein
MTAQPPATPRLDLAELRPDAVRSSFWSRLPALFAPELRLRESTVETIRELDARHPEHLRRHGAEAVLRFYDRELLPAVDRLPPGPDRWRLHCQLAGRALAIAAATGAAGEAVARAERLRDLLPRARLADDPEVDSRLHRQLRTFLASQLAGAADRLVGDGREREALRAHEVLDQLGSTDPGRRADHALLRWRARDRSSRAISLYLRALAEDPPPDPERAEIESFLEERLAVGEELTDRELSDRLFFNLLALSSPRPPAPAWRNAGVAFLGLGQPERSLPYLERALSVNGDVNGADGGTAAFYLGRAHFQTEDFSASAEAFERAVEGGYDRLRIAAWQGVAYARARRWEEALATFRQAEEAAGEVMAGEFYLQWGRACFLVGEHPEAEQRFRQAATRDGDDPRIDYGVSFCLEVREERSRAVETLRSTAGRWPDFAPASHRLGRLLQAAGEGEEARHHLQRAVAAAPDDPEYRLALGLALDDAEDPEALPHLEWAGRAGVGGPEVLRRLALGHFHRGERPRGRRWLAALAAGGPVSPAVARFLARDRASQATETFNAGEYRRAAELWQEVAADHAEAPSSGPGAVTERLALALACDGLARLREGDSAARELLGRAHGLAPEQPDCRFLYAVGEWSRGRFENAADLLRDLPADPGGDPGPAKLAALAAAVGAEGGAEELTRRAAEAEGTERGAWTLLAVQVAVEAGDFAAAGVAVESWIADGEALRAPLPRLPVNALVAFAKLRATRRKRQRVLHSLHQLSTGEDGIFWTPARILAEHAVAVARGPGQAGDADPEALASCEAGYRELLEQAGEGERPPLLRALSKLLRFTVLHHLQRGAPAAALAALERLEEEGIELPPAFAKVALLLRDRLSRPSHESAWALLAADPEAAKEVWQRLLADHPDDLVARHHLACLAWSEAYDAAVAGDIEASLPGWSEGLEHFRQLDASEEYWRSLRDKGRALGTTAVHPFDEAAFETWRGEALYLLARKPLELIFRHLAGCDLTRRGDELDPRIADARSLVELLRSSRLEAPTVERLADDLADHYLDPDPTRVPDFEHSRRRAETVVDLDPENLKARAFLLRSATHEIDTRREEGDRRFPTMAKTLTRLRRHAEWLESQLEKLSEERRPRASGTLVAYYDQCGLIRHADGQKATGELNAAAGRLSPGEARRKMEKIKKCYRDSDRWLQKSLELDPVNPRARDTLEHHQTQYEPLEENLRQLREIDRFR